MFILLIVYLLILFSNYIIMHKIMRKIVSVAALTALLWSNYVYNWSVFAIDWLWDLLVPTALSPIEDNLELTMPVQNAIVEPIKEVQPTLERHRWEITICKVDPNNVWDPREVQVNRFSSYIEEGSLDYVWNCLMPKMTVEKTNSWVVVNEDGTYTVVYNVTVKNIGWPWVYNLEDELEPLPAWATATVLWVLHSEDDDTLALPDVNPDFNALDKWLIIENELIKKDWVDRYTYKINYSVNPETISSETNCNWENNEDKNLLKIENYVKVVYDDFIIENTGRFTKLNTYKHDISGTCNEVTIPEMPKYGSVDWWKFNDLDGSWYWNDGSQSGSIAEPGLNWFEITLQSSDLAKTYTWVTFTDSFWWAWYFTFTWVLVWSYKLCEVNQAGWHQTYPDETISDVVNGCHNVEIMADTNIRRYFGNHYVWVPETWTGTTETWTGTTETWSGSTETWTGTTETGSGTTQTGSWITETSSWTTEDNSRGQESFQQAIKSTSGSGWGGWRWVRKLISYDVKNTVEAAWLWWNTEENIVKHYNEYLEKLNRLSDIIKAENPELDQEKKILQNYLEGTYVSSKYKNQINNVIKKLAKLDKEKKQEMILKLFAKLEAAEIKFENNNSILNLISYLKLKLSIAYSS